MSIASLLFRLLSDALTYFWLLFRPNDSLAAEILFLRKQLALYQERQSSRNPSDPATRFTMVILSKRFDWRDALVIVKPRTLVRWHRLGFRLVLTSYLGQVKQLTGLFLFYVVQTHVTCSHSLNALARNSR